MLFYYTGQNMRAQNYIITSVINALEQHIFHSESSLSCSGVLLARSLKSGPKPCLARTQFRSLTKILRSRQLHMKKQISVDFVVSLSSSLLVTRASCLFSVVEGVQRQNVAQTKFIQKEIVFGFLKQVPKIFLSGNIGFN